MALQLSLVLSLEQEHLASSSRQSVDESGAAVRTRWMHRFQNQTPNLVEEEF
jgi:hypothetical protein